MTNDLSITHLNGLDIKTELAKRGARRPVIFLSGNGSIPQALEPGACDFSIKSLDREELLGAIKIATKRDSYRLHCETVARRVDNLTPRERQVLALATRGLFNKEIAAALGTVENTVNVNRKRGMKKMGVKSVAELGRITRMLDQIQDRCEVEEKISRHQTIC